VASEVASVHEARDLILSAAPALNEVRPARPSSAWVREGEHALSEALRGQHHRSANHASDTCTRALKVTRLSVCDDAEYLARHPLNPTPG
jgi:hypothetical protein